MQEKVINDLNSLVNLLEKFYEKYSNNKNVSIIKDLKDIIEELKTINFQNISDVNNINNIIKKLNVANKILNRILEKINDVCYSNFQKYSELKEYLANREYYSKDDRDKAFQDQLKYNNYDIYLINGTNLVNLFHRERIISFATRDELDKYIEKKKKYGMEIIIEPKTNNFEEEYKNYYNYLLKHGYTYSISDEYCPLSIAMELATLFEGQVLTEGFIMYEKCFQYPKDFDNAEYLEKLKEFLALNENKEFLKDYKELQELKEKIQLNINILFSLSQRYDYVIEKLKENLSSNLSNEILFLDKCYILFGPKFGYWEYIYEDYYKALDFEFLRKSLGKKDVGAWKINKNVKHYWDENYTTCLYAEYFSWNSLSDVRKGNKELKQEIDDIKNSSIEEIEELTQDKYIIESNSNLDYETLLNEYYSNFGMNPREFVEMIQTKYDCKVVFPNLKSQSTKLAVRKAG